MLLTSSQVSVLITTGMVLLCTSALFISGCLIQQRTLRDLRSAIRPAVVTRPKPKVWDTQQRRIDVKTTIRLEDGTLVEIQGPSADAVPVALDPVSPEEQEQDQHQIIEVQLTPREAEELELGQKPAEPSPPALDSGDGSGGGKEESESGSVAAAWDGVQEGGEPLSRAERRRRIKAEIQRLSQGDTPVYYQRRLW
ncbi:hypothetical protein F5Y10DRAFT_254070 [Nemania abortiva]|nr:hypothetical protein F5Y10DRAFT_254070 [Nemania abortiva]